MISTVLTGALFLVSLAHAAPSNFPVCIVGTGPSGLVTARKLEAKGYDVVMFEKQTSVGGKSQSYYDPYVHLCQTMTFHLTSHRADGSYHPLGGLLFSNGTYTESLKVIAQTNVLSTPFNTGTRYTYNYTTGVTTQNAPVTAAFATLMGSEYQRYAVFWSTVWAPYNAMRYKVCFLPVDIANPCS